MSDEMFFTLCLFVLCPLAGILLYGAATVPSGGSINIPAEAIADMVSIHNKADVVQISDCRPHIVREVVCLKCLRRWIAVYPEKTLLKDLECGCGETGKVIATGQEIEGKSC